MSTTQAASDLVWVLNSPSLVAGAGVAAPVHLAVADIDQIALESFVADRASHRVGRYFETLLLFWLQHIQKVEVVGSAIQIRAGNRTIGELDYLFVDHHGKLNHWEAAVKFFLHYPRAGASNFPGPNPVDDFERKTTQLFEKQLPLSKAHYPDVEVRKAFVKGRIFYHLLETPPDLLPAGMAPDHETGKWLHESELPRLDDHYSGFGHVVFKPHWLAPVLGAEQVEVAELAETLRTHFVESGHPVMVSISTDGDSETERLFVVGNSWPKALTAA